MNPLQAARIAIDKLHAADPKKNAAGVALELLYANHMEAALQHLQPDAPALLLLGARCQHLCRWTVPRNSFPLDKVGYHAWRKSLYIRQADLARDTLLQVGVSQEEASQVHTWVSKAGLGSNEGTQALEDAACLVFLEHEVPGFAASHPDYTEEKYIDILRKTWRKMSPAAREHALKLPLPDTLRTLLQKALG